MPYNGTREHLLLIKQMHQHSGISPPKCREWLCHAEWDVDRAINLAMQDARRRWPGW